MIGLLLTAGVVVICAGLLLFGWLVVVALREPRYDIDAATAAYHERCAAGDSLTVMTVPESEGAVS